MTQSHTYLFNLDAILTYNHIVYYHIIYYSSEGCCTSYTSVYMTSKLEWLEFEVSVYSVCYKEIMDTCQPIGGINFNNQEDFYLYSDRDHVIPHDWKITLVVGSKNWLRFVPMEVK